MPGLLFRLRPLTMALAALLCTFAVQAGGQSASQRPSGAGASKAKAPVLAWQPAPEYLQNQVEQSTRGLQIIDYPVLQPPVQPPRIQQSSPPQAPSSYSPVLGSSASFVDEARALREAAQALGEVEGVELRHLPLLREGSRGEHVVTLRQALAGRGFAASGPEEDYFDADLAQAVRDAQQALGLGVDGVAGPILYAALSADSSQLAAEASAWANGLERVVAQAKSRGARRIVVVNLAAYTLWVINATTGATELESRVIVGTPRTKTPRMAMDIINLKYNPDWSPPKSIRGARYTPPGPNNPLGQVRFSTNSGISIYLHDTNNHSLFERDNRALSHGCVRVSAWQELAAVLAEISPEEVLAKTEGNKIRVESLDPVPVVLGYGRTALREGALVRVPDVYGLGDEVVMPSLRSRGTQADADAPEL